MFAAKVLQYRVVIVMTYRLKYYILQGKSYNTELVLYYNEVKTEVLYFRG